MSDQRPTSIQRELTELEATGRVSARDQREVHTAFGFESIQRDPVPAGTTAPAVQDVGAQLDDAWSRLKRKINPE